MQNSLTKECEFYRLDYWVKRNGCSDRTQEDSFEGDVHHISWTCGGKAGALQHWKVDDMGKFSFPVYFVWLLTVAIQLGHVWASTEPNFSQLAALELPTHIQASEIIMKFFSGFTKP